MHSPNICVHIATFKNWLTSFSQILSKEGNGLSKSSISLPFSLSPIYTLHSIFPHMYSCTHTYNKVWITTYLLQYKMAISPNQTNTHAHMYCNRFTRSCDKGMLELCVSIKHIGSCRQTIKTFSFAKVNPRLLKQ